MFGTENNQEAVGTIMLYNMLRAITLSHPKRCRLTTATLPLQHRSKVVSGLFVSNLSPSDCNMLPSLITAVAAARCGIDSTDNPILLSAGDIHGHCQNSAALRW